MFRLLSLFIFTVCGYYVSVSDVRGELLPLIVSTGYNNTNATKHAWNLLQDDQPLLDCLERGISEMCEIQYCSDSIGPYGNIDESGRYSLDAMIMNGDNYDVGAVGGLRNVRGAISVARAVMEYTQHTFIVGDDATAFAEEMQFPLEDLRDEARWNAWKNRSCQPNYRKNVTPDPNENCGPYTPITDDASSVGSKSKKSSTKDSPWPEGVDTDTIGMVIVDGDDHVVAGVSTNGLEHKVPGRVGDSPIAGAGAYGVSGIGAAACTGNGDVMMRFLPSFIAVEGLRNGKTPNEAGRDAMVRIRDVHPNQAASVVVVNTNGEFAALCTGKKEHEINYMKPGMTDPEVVVIDCETSMLPPTTEPPPAEDGSANFRGCSILILTLLSLILS